MNPTMSDERVEKKYNERLTACMASRCRRRVDDSATMVLWCPLAL